MTRPDAPHDLAALPPNPYTAQAAARGLPAYFSTHNYWLVCPRAYLMTGGGAICAGPGDGGGDCAAAEVLGHVRLIEASGVPDEVDRGQVGGRGDGQDPPPRRRRSG